MYVLMCVYLYVCVCLSVYMYVCEISYCLFLESVSYLQLQRVEDFAPPLHLGVPHVLCVLRLYARQQLLLYQRLNLKQVFSAEVNKNNNSNALILLRFIRILKIHITAVTQGVTKIM